MSSYAFLNMSDYEIERARQLKDSDPLEAQERLSMAMDAYNAQQRQHIIREIGRQELKQRQQKAAQNVAAFEYREAMHQSNQQNGVERHGDEFSLIRTVNDRLWIVSYLQDPDAYYVVFADDPKTKHLSQAFETVEGAYSAAMADEQIQLRFADDVSRETPEYVPPISEWPEHERREYEEWSESVRLNPQTDQNEDM